MKTIASVNDRVKLDLIYPNPDQPRKEFSQRKLGDLPRSIQENGLMEPIVVTPRGDRFMIIAGERRFRACRLAGLAEAPVRVLEADDRKVAVLALLENLQREGLDLIEEALGWPICRLSLWGAYIRHITIKGNL